MKTGLLSILLSFLAAADTAGQVPAINGFCECRQRPVLALNSKDVNLRSGDTNRSQFRWLPRAKEHRWIYVVVHHSATTGGSVEAIHREHSRRKDAAGQAWLGIGYHFVIGNGTGMEDGATEATFRWRRQIHGAHSGSAVHNANGIGVCLIGDLQNKPPSQRQIRALTDLIGQLSDRYNIPARLVIGHNTVKPTSCPGRLLPLKKLVNSALSANESNS